MSDVLLRYSIYLFINLSAKIMQIFGLCNKFFLFEVFRSVFLRYFNLFV